MSHPKDAWDPTQYEQFRAEREQPFWDLLALVRARPGLRVIDLGCGTGALTRALHRRLGARETLGIDSSQAMLARAAELAEPGLRFERADIAEVASLLPWDLVFSNAALHWVPGHQGVLTRLTGLLADGGQLAVQMPANDDQPSHRVATELAAEPPFAAALAQAGPPGRATLLLPEQYAELLERLGYREQHVRLQIYGHHLAARDQVVEWVRGTLLTDYQRRLPPELYALFLERYRARLLARLPDRRPFFFTYRRLLLWALR
ncbi:MAG TPA: methyltransferase domain-containing protein [Polyangia bacterium]|nr:methyltransferase domain-containing protein [Polyangia bacterium]